MRRRLLVYTLFLSLLIALLPGLTRANGSTPALTLIASSTQVATGQTFDLTVQISGASSIYGSSVDLTYDPTLLEYIEGSAQGLLTAGLASNQYYAAILNRSFATPASLSVIAIRLGRTVGGASGTGNLATFKFKGLREGPATFTVNGTSIDVQMVDPANAAVAFSASATGVTVQIGPPPPGPAITEPLEGSFIPSWIFEVSGSGPANSQLIPAINAADQVWRTVGADGYFSFPMQVFSDGAYSISVRKTDATAPDAVTSIIVDAQYPVLGLVTATLKPQSTISGTVTELNLDKLYVQANPTGNPVEEDAVTVETDGSSAVARTLGIGANTIKVTALDKAGNASVTTIPVDVPEPITPTLRLVSSAQQVGVDATFSVAVQVVNPDELVSAELVITYPAQLLEVVDAQTEITGIQNTPGPLLDQVLTNTVNPSTGTITYAASNTSGTVQADGTLMTITFKALALGSAPISFGTTVVENATGANAVHVQESTEVTVASGGIVTGQVSLAGRGSSARAGATVKLVGHPISAVTAADGSFTLLDVPVGAQQLLIRFPNPHAESPAYSVYMAQVIGVNVESGVTTSVPLVAMKGGDANGDNAVSLSDLVILATNYGLNQSSPSYDARADFTGDNAVSLSDLVVLAGSYGQQGAATPTRE